MILYHKNIVNRALMLLLYIVLLPVFTGNRAYAQQAEPTAEYQVKAVFLFNFTRFVEWPPFAYDAYNEPFIINILGNDPFGQYLDETVSGEKVGMHPIQVRRITDSRQVEKCHMLFISEKDPAKIKSILANVQDKHILTVGDARDFAALGGIIGFYTDNNKIRMQINSRSSKNAQLEISSKLLRLAKVL